MAASFIHLDEPAIWEPLLLSSPIVSSLPKSHQFQLPKWILNVSLLPVSVTTAIAKLSWSLASTMEQIPNRSVHSYTPMIQFLSHLFSIWCQVFLCVCVCFLQILQRFPFVLGMTSNLLSIVSKVLNYLTPKCFPVSPGSMLPVTLSLSVALNFFISQYVTGFTTATNPQISKP